MDSDFETRPLLDDGEPDIDTESYVQSQQAQKRQYRRRRYLLGTAGVLLAMLVVLLIVFVTLSPRGRQESQLPPLDEELAHDSRLEVGFNNDSDSPVDILTSHYRNIRLLQMQSHALNGRNLKNTPLVIHRVRFSALLPSSSPHQQT